MKISLKAARINAELTQKEAADLMGIDKKTLSNWETSKTSPDVFQMLKLCSIYGVSMDDIFLKPKSTLSVSEKG